MPNHNTTTQSRIDGLQAALRAIVAECCGPARPYSDDSYLPAHFLEAALAALEGAPTDDAGNWQQYRLDASETAAQIIERERAAYANLLQSVHDERRSKASAPVAGEALRRGNFLPEHVTQQMIWNIQTVSMDQCHGLKLSTQQARNIMAFLMNEHGPDAALQASADAVDLARAGMDLHAHGAPEHTVCAELVRLADALKQQHQVTGEDGIEGMQGDLP